MGSDWLQPEFSSAGIALGLGLLAYLVLVEPALGLRCAAYLRRHSGERLGALLRVYGLTLAVHASWLVVVALILLVSPIWIPARADDGQRARVPEVYAGPLDGSHRSGAARGAARRVVGGHRLLNPAGVRSPVAPWI